MKITKTQLKQIIREALAEADDWYSDEHETLADRKYDDQVEQEAELDRRERFEYILYSFQRLSDEWAPDPETEPMAARYKDELAAVLASFAKSAEY